MRLNPASAEGSSCRLVSKGCDSNVSGRMMCLEMPVNILEAVQIVAMPKTAFLCKSTGYVIF